MAGTLRTPLIFWSRPKTKVVALLVTFLGTKRVAFRLHSAEWLRQLGDVAGDPAGFIRGDNHSRLRN
jgi:hypothetical protein